MDLELRLFCRNNSVLPLDQCNRQICRLRLENVKFYILHFQHPVSFSVGGSTGCASLFFGVVANRITALSVSYTWEQQESV